MTQFDQVSVIKRANVYFDGLCVSHTLLLPDGSKKTVGVIFPSKLVFNTGLAERMEINAGLCKVKVIGKDDWQMVHAGEQFEVPANSQFEIETLELLDYVCHFIE